MSQLIREGVYWCVLSKPIDESGFTVLQKTHMCSSSCSGGSDVDKKALRKIGKLVMAQLPNPEGLHWFLGHYGGRDRDEHHALFIGPCDDTTRVDVKASLHRANVINRCVLFHDY